MKDKPTRDDSVPAEIDFSKGVRGLHHVPPNAKVFVPAPIERDIWEYFSRKAQQNGIELSELLTEVLRRDTEINEARKRFRASPRSFMVHPD